MPKPPTHKRQTLSELRELQRLTGAALFRPLAEGDALDPVWIDGRDMHEVASEFIKPNDRLTSFERVEIYARSYWFRILECLYDDYPGLRAVLGDERFMTLARQYLADCPSRSYTLRNLGRRLSAYVREHPNLSAPHTQLAADVCQLEWAQIQAFDGSARKPITVHDLLGADPQTLQLRLQPCMSILQLHYPLDAFLIGLKRDRSRSEASDAIDSAPSEKRRRKIQLPRRKMIYLAVHRHENSVYYKRLTAESFALLSALQVGEPLAQACEIAFRPMKGQRTSSARAKGSSRKKPIDAATVIRNWFQTWTGLGWFCKA